MIRTVEVKAKQKVSIFDSKGHVLAIDATISEEHLFTSQATMHEIEGGDSVSDHVIKKPIQLTLTGVISGDPYPDEANTNTNDTPPPGPQAWDGTRYVRIGSGALSGMVGSIAGGGAAGGIISFGASKLSGSLLQKAVQIQNDATRKQIEGKVGDNGPSLVVKNAYDILRGIYAEKLVVSIQTGLNLYENLVMESLNLSRNKDTVRSLPFTASFRQIVFVASETVKIPDFRFTDTQATTDRATPKQNQGTKQTKQNAAVQARAASMAYKLGAPKLLHKLGELIGIPFPEE